MSKFQYLSSYILYDWHPKHPITIQIFQIKYSRNPNFSEQVKGVSIICREEAINWGSTGPMLPASGIKWDLRKVDHCQGSFVAP